MIKSGLAGFGALSLLQAPGVVNAGEETIKRETFVKLTSNENPYGYSPDAKRILAEALDDGSHYASSASIGKLEQQIADREGLKAENVVLGTGSVDTSLVYVCNPNNPTASVSPALFRKYTEWRACVWVTDWHRQTLPKSLRSIG